MCTVTPHLSSAVGVLLTPAKGTSAETKSNFHPLIDRETAVPCRRSGIFTYSSPAPAPSKSTDDNTATKQDTPGSGAQEPGILIRLVEATPAIHTEEIVKEKKAKKASASDSDSDSEDDDEEEDDEPQIHRSRTWSTGATLAELAIRLPASLASQPDSATAPKPSSKSKSKASGAGTGKIQIEVTVDIAADLTLTITARQKAGKHGSKGSGGGGGGVRGKIDPVPVPEQAGGSGTDGVEVKENGTAS